MGTSPLRTSARLLTVYATACAAVVFSCGKILVLASGASPGCAVALSLLILSSVLCTAGGAWCMMRAVHRSTSAAAEIQATATAAPFPAAGAAPREHPHDPHLGQETVDSYPDRCHILSSPEEGSSPCADLFATFMAHLPAMVVLKDQAGRYLYANPGCRKLLHKSPAEMIGRTDAELFPAAVAETLARNDHRVTEDRAALSSVEKITLDGEHRCLEVTKFAVAVSGRVPLLASITFDVTAKSQAEEERAELEQQLIQAQKMEAIGTLASGITHDFNNILGAIFGYVELARLDSLHNEKVQLQLEQVMNAAQRAKDLVRQILTFSRRHEHDRKPLDLVPLIKEALKLLRASLPSTITIRSEFNPDGALVLADATQMHQVIMNLCTNAAQAMEPNGGELTVCLNKVRVGTSTDEHSKTGGPFLELSVRDTGEGIGAGLEKRLFEPYFTTKAPGKGTGMGLAVVNSIIKSHGGAVEVQSRAGEGSCFTVRVPATESVIQVPTTRSIALPRGTESILFVDDEPFLADLGRQMLGRLGYRTVCSTSSVEALQVIRTHPEYCDLLITDMTMPHMTGEALIREVRAIRPDRR